MDRDYLKRRLEEELQRAASATCSESRRSHEELAQRYAEQIEAQSGSQQAA